MVAGTTASNTESPKYALAVAAIICVIIAALSFLTERLVPDVSAPIAAVVIGLFVTNVLRSGSLEIRRQYSAVSKWGLQAAIVCIGMTLTLSSIFALGAYSLGIMIVTVVGAVTAALLVGALLGVPWKTRCLIGAGTAICGASAIAAVAPAVKADANDTAGTISVVFLFNILAIFIFPTLGHTLGLDDLTFGAWSGMAVNDTSAVVAVGYAYSEEAGNLAVITKLARILMIIPMTVILAIITIRREGREMGENKLSIGRLRKALPLFILFFFIAVLANSSGILGDSSIFGLIGKVLLVIALAAVGLQANIRTLAANGMNFVILGMTTWIILAASALFLILRG